MRQPSAAGAVLAAVMCAGWGLSACAPQPAPCPAIAAAPFVTVEIAPERAAALSTFHARACQGGNCREADLELLHDERSGGKLAHLDMGVLTEEQVELEIRATHSDGTTSTAALDFPPAVEYPYGEHCGKFIHAVAVWDGQGLRPA